MRIAHMNEHDEHDGAGHNLPAMKGPDMTDLAEQLVAAAAGQGLDLTGENGLLTALTKQVLQSALEVEMSHHLGCDRADPAGRSRGNLRNGTTPKTITTDVGKVTVQVPRDRDGSYEPQIVRKHQRRRAGFDDGTVAAAGPGRGGGVDRQARPRAPRLEAPRSGRWSVTAATSSPKPRCCGGCATGV